MAGKVDSNDPEEVQKQISQMWGMLDDLAEQDPESYQKFIQNNLTQGAELFAKPKPEHCIRTVFNTTKRYLYVNIFSWGQITPPKSNQAAIPMLASKLKEIDIGTSNVMVIAVAINAKVFEEVSGSKDETKQLYKLVLTFVKETRDLDIALEYQLLKATSKGDPSICSKLLYEETIPKSKLQNPDSSYKQPPPLDDDINPNSVIGQLANLCTEKENENFAGKKTKKLIEEIPSEDIEKETPLYTIVIAKTEEGEVLKLCITLPGVSAASEVDLRISRDCLLLSNNRYDLDMKFKREIDEKSVKTEFDMSEHILRISASCIPKYSS